MKIVSNVLQRKRDKEDAAKPIFQDKRYMSRRMYVMRYVLNGKKKKRKVRYRVLRDAAEIRIYIEGTKYKAFVIKTTFRKHWKRVIDYMEREFLPEGAILNKDKSYITVGWY